MRAATPRGSGVDDVQDVVRLQADGLGVEALPGGPIRRVRVEVALLQQEGALPHQRGDRVGRLLPQCRRRANPAVFMLYPVQIVSLVAKNPACKHPVFIDETDAIWFTLFYHPQPVPSIFLVKTSDTPVCLSTDTRANSHLHAHFRPSPSVTRKKIFFVFLPTRP